MNLLNLKWILVEQNEPHVHTKTFDFEIVIVNAKGEIIQRESKQAQCEIEDLGNGVTLEMVSIPRWDIYDGFARK
jgi:hypothetical protein